MTKHRRRKWSGVTYHLCWVRSAFQGQPDVLMAYVGRHTSPRMELWIKQGEGEQEFVGRVKDSISRSLVKR